MRKQFVLLLLIFLVVLSSSVIAYDDGTSDAVIPYSSSTMSGAKRTYFSGSQYSSSELASCSTFTNINTPVMRFIGFTNNRDADTIAALHSSLSTTDMISTLQSMLQSTTINKCTDTSYLAIEDASEQQFGAQLAGYIYVKDSIDLMVGYTIRDSRAFLDDCWDTEHSDPKEFRWTLSGVAVGIYAVDAFGMPTELVSSNYEYDGYCQCSDCDGWAGLLASSDKMTFPYREPSARDAHKYVAPGTLEPGVYLLFLDARVEVGKDENDYGKITINLNDGKFQTTSGTETTLASDLSGTGNRLSSEKYFISKSFLTEGELSSFDFFDGDSSQVFCESIGGDYNSEIGPSSKRCCGDSPDDDGYIHPSTGWTCIVSESGLGGEWVPFLDGYYDEESQTAVPGYCSTAYPFADSLSYTEASSITDFSVSNALDGCCGDDEEGDLAYTTTYGRYFCGRDLYNDKISFNDDATWKWWDASAPGSPFRIHSQLDVDYISNGAQWFYCNATGDVPPRGGATPIAEGESFTSATGNGFFSCANALNSIPEAFTHLDNPQAFSICESDDGDPSFCCFRNSDGDLSGYNPQNGFLNELECLDNCYIAPSTSLGEYITDPDNFQSINNTFCTLYPNDQSCDPTGDSFPTFPSGAEEIQKSYCGYNLAGCLDVTADLNSPCNSIELTIQDELFKGVLCGESEYEYCASNQYILSSDVQTSQQNDLHSQVCCLAPDDPFSLNTNNQCKPITPEVTEQQCRAAGGDYLPEMQQAQYTCTPTNVVVGNCCLGGRWLPNWNFPGSEITFAQPDAFVCYEQAGANHIAECCTDFSTCFNAEDNSLFSSQQANAFGHGYYGKGGVLHTLRNFDKTDTDGILRDFVLIQRSINANNFVKISFDNNVHNQRQLFDWTSFNYLEFDVAFNIDALTHVVLYNDYPVNHETACVSEKTLSEYLVNGKGPMRWHHVVIPLDDFNCQNFNFEDVTELRIKTDYSADNLQVALDSFFLSEDATKTNTDNYYCTGNFGQWISNLDGPTDEGFAEDATFTQIGPYWYACEAQASFGWTGSRCCGDDTRSFAGGGEYYVDTRGACFSGKTVYSDMTVAEAHNANQFKDVLYYIDSEGEKGFYVCNYEDDSSINYGNYYISYNETSTTTLLFDLTEPFLKEDFEIVGTHVCLPSKEWVSVDSISKARIIAAKLFDIATEEIDENDPHFTIHCDNMTLVQPLDLSSPDGGLGLNNFASSVRDSCVLSYADSAELIQENILIGLSLQQTTVQEFLEQLYEHIQVFDEALMYLEGEDELLAQARDEFITACDGIIAGDARDDFFVVCDYDGAYGLRMAYNPEFNILFLAYTTDEDQYGGIFNQKGSILSFVQEFFTELFNWFGSWFTPSDSEITFSAEALLPIFNDEMISFENFYLHVQGEKQIMGLAERRANTGAENTDTDDDWYVTIEYTNINSSIAFLADNYYTQHPLALNYVYGNETNEDGEFTQTQKQILALINPHQSEQKLAYEPLFDWRRLMSGFVLDTSVTFDPAPPLYETIHGDGIIQLGEACDYVHRCTSTADFQAEQTPTGCDTHTSEDTCIDTTGCEWTQDIVFKFNQDSCEFWNNNFEPENSVSCYLNDFTLDYSACSLKSCEERRLYTRSYQVYQHAPATFGVESYNPTALATTVETDDDVCCSDITDCLYDGACYASGTFTTFTNDKQFQCQAGIWKLLAPESVMDGYAFQSPTFTLANQKGCDVYENHSFCTQSQLCVITPTICECDSSCETRNDNGVCVSNCPENERCNNGVCCADSCVLDDLTDLERCANGCHPEPKEYCWNVCELENTYCTGEQMDYPDNDPYNEGGWDDWSTTSSEPDFCSTHSYMVTPDLDCTFIFEYDCTESQCTDNANGCAWQQQTMQDIIDSETTSGGSSGGGGSGGHNGPDNSGQEQDVYYTQ